MFQLDWTIYSLVTLMGGLVSLFSVAMLWPRRADPAARWLGLLMLACGQWSLCTALEFAEITLEASLVWARLSYFGIVVSPPLFLIFATAFIRQYALKRAARGALFVVPALILAAVLSNDLHHLFWLGHAIDPVTHLVQYDRGPVFNVFLIYTYAACGTALVVLVAGAVKSQALYLGQRVAVLVGGLIPLLVNLLYVTGSLPVPHMDWTPTSFAFCGIVLAMSLRRQRLFDLRPMLRSRLLDVMTEAVMLVDEHGRIADYNQAMARLVPEIVDTVGLQCGELFPRHPELCAVLGAEEEIDHLIEFGVPGQERSFEVRARRLAYESGRARGHLVVLHDVTAEHQLQLERDGLLADLRLAVARVQELGGMLPICANCKKIRDDQGYWHNVETFLAEHSEAEMSEAICPDCQAKLAAEAAEHEQAGDAQTDAASA